MSREISGISRTWTIAYEKGIISDKYKNSNMNAQAARLEFAEILGGALLDDALAEINEAPDGTIPDVSSVSDAGQAGLPGCTAPEC